MPVALELMLPRALHGVSVRGTLARKASSVADSIEESTRDSTIRQVGESVAGRAVRVVSAPSSVARDISDSLSRYNPFPLAFFKRHSLIRQRSYIFYDATVQDDFLSSQS